MKNNKRGSVPFYSFYTIKELPETDRPREKLLRFGVENLTDSELLAILLRTGVKGKNAIELAREVLNCFNGLSGLLNASIKELLSFKGLGKTKAITLIAALELGKRVTFFRDFSTKITSPENVFKILLAKQIGLKVEVFGLLTLNSKGKLISIHEVTKGGSNFTSITPKEVFYPAIKDMAEAVILFHNHPSGDPTPSKEDIEITQKLLECASFLDIEILDHVILGKDSFFSFKKEGLL
ncbi:MAG: DNA repair protein RadC [Desulfurobacteriaceae bacterium]